MTGSPPLDEVPLAAQAKTAGGAGGGGAAVWQLPRAAGREEQGGGQLGCIHSEWGGGTLRSPAVGGACERSGRGPIGGVVVSEAGRGGAGPGTCAAQRRA